MRRFFRSKLSIVGLVMIAFLFLFSFLGPVIYNKWGEDQVDDRKTTNTFEVTYKTRNANGDLVEVIELVDFVSNTNNYASPDKEHLLGTDDKGMDVFVRLMYGGRISLTIGFLVVILETLIGVIMGEFLVSKEGVGYLINYGSEVFNLNLVFAGIFILLLVSYLMYLMVVYIEKILIKNN